MTEPKRSREIDRKTKILNLKNADDMNNEKSELKTIQRIEYINLTSVIVIQLH